MFLSCLLLWYNLINLENTLWNQINNLDDKKIFKLEEDFKELEMNIQSLRNEIAAFVPKVDPTLHLGKS